MEINGTPLHPLIVHAAVVFTPLAALSVLAFFFLRSRRASLRLPTLALAVICGLSLGAAFLSGNGLFNSRSFYRTNKLVLQHKEHATQLLYVGIAFAVVAVIAVLMAAVPARVGTTGPDREAAGGAASMLLAVAAIVLAIAVLGLVAWVGDLGARAAWGGGGLIP